MPEKQILVRGASLLARASADLERKDILIGAGRITAIEPPGQLDEHRATARVIDGRGKLVIPGLVNAHYHSHDVLSRGMYEDIPLEVWIALAIMPPSRPLSTREVRLRTLLGAIEYGRLAAPHHCASAARAPQPMRSQTSSWCCITPA